MNYPNRIIKEGEADTAIVKFIQNRLNAIGLGPFEVSGTFGPKTKSAIKQFQATHRDQFGNPLETDGKVGSITWAVLFDVQQPVANMVAAPTVLLTAAVDTAHTQIGIMENPPGSNKGQEVDQYLLSVALNPGFFWCAALFTGVSIKPPPV